MLVFVSMFYIFGIIMSETWHSPSALHYFLGVVGRIACILVALHVVEGHYKVCGKCQS